MALSDCKCVSRQMKQNACIRSPPPLPNIAQLSLLELFRNAERAFGLTSTAEIFIDCAKASVHYVHLHVLTDPSHVRMSFRE